MRGNTICDCLIFTEKRGVIGIEIKTERDSTKRLNKQLKDYEKVCDFVYVLCHDTHVPKVEQILNRYNHRHVGILAYTEFMVKLC
ncbi:sce7726 family protein [Enterococcus faecium]|nr:sce7726 family protein [Enterococcus faecium]